MSQDDVQVPVASAEAGPSRQSSVDIHSLQPEIIVIGAGIAGSALAYSLSHTGRKVLLLERDLSEPDRIVGELLQPGGLAALFQMGLGECLEGIDATPVEGYCIVQPGGERMVEVDYPDLGVMAGESRVEFGGEKSHGSGKATAKGDVDGDRDGYASGLRKRRANGEANNQHYGHTSGHNNEHTNGCTNGHANAQANGHLNGFANEEAKGANGHSNGDTSSSWHVTSLSGKKEGRCFHHGRFVSSLRRACLTSAPNLTVVEATVRDLVFCEHTSRVIGVSAAFKIPCPTTDPTSSTSESNTTVVRTVYAPLTIIADGCFSKFRSAPGSRVPKSKVRSHFVGVILKDAELPRPHMGTVCLTPSGPVLIYQIGDKAGESRMLVDIKGKLPNAADGSLRDHIATHYLPHLPPKLHATVQEALDTRRLRTMPNSFLPSSMQGLSSNISGAIMVGDAWNMRLPLTGGGMTVALHDAVLLTEYLRPSEELPAGREGLQDWDVVSVKLREWFWKRKDVAGSINVLSMALYDLFGGADQPELEILREGVFRYFELGGECIAGPIGLLSALTPKPLMLFYHFFSVAFYSMYILFAHGAPARPGDKSVKPGWLDVPSLFLYSWRVFWTACVVIVPVIWTEFRI